MKFLVRDDDTCYYTQVEELENCYSKIYTEIPICLSVTPFRVAGKYFSSNQKPDAEIPLDSNRDLVNYLKERISLNHYDIALHGYSHIYYNDKNHQERTPEYAVNEGLLNKTTLGKTYLENTLNTKVSTFVPPSNAISKHGIDVIVNNEMNLMNIPGFRKRPKEWLSLMNTIKTRAWKLKYKYDIYPYLLYFENHKEMDSHLLYPSTDLDELLKRLEFVHSINGIFSLATHYHAFKQRIKSGQTIEYAFNKIIERLMQLNNVDYITYKQLWT